MTVPSCTSKNYFDVQLMTEQPQFVYQNDSKPVFEPPIDLGDGVRKPKEIGKPVDEAPIDAPRPAKPVVFPDHIGFPGDDGAWYSSHEPLLKDLVAFDDGGPLQLWEDPGWRSMEERVKRLEKQTPAPSAPARPTLVPAAGQPEEQFVTDGWPPHGEIKGVVPKGRLLPVESSALDIAAKGTLVIGMALLTALATADPAPGDEVLAGVGLTASWGTYLSAWGL